MLKESDHISAPDLWRMVLHTFNIFSKTYGNFGKSVVQYFYYRNSERRKYGTHYRRKAQPGA